MNFDVKIIEQFLLYILTNGWYIVALSLVIGFIIKWTPGLKKISDFIPLANAIIAAVIAYFFKPFPDLQLPAQITLSLVLALAASPFYDKIIKPFETHIINFIQKWLAKILGVEK